MVVEIETRVTAKRARVYSVREMVGFDNPMDKFIYTMFAAHAEYQRAFTREMTRANMRSYQRNGKLMSAKPPYGFTKAKEDGKWILVPDATEQIRKAEMMRLPAGGMPIRQIVFWLNENGLYQRCGRPWKPTCLYRMFRRWLSRDEPDPEKYEYRHPRDHGNDRIGSLLDSEVPLERQS